MRRLAGGLFSRKNAHLPGNLGESCDFSKSGRGALGFRLEGRDLGFGVALTPLRHDAGRRFGEPRLDLEPARFFRARNPQRAPQIGEDRLARAHFTAPLFARHWL